MDSVVELLSKLVAIPSVNPMGGDVDPAICYEGRVSDWLEDFFKGLGVEYERIAVAPGRDNVIARLDRPGAGTTILLDAHQEKNPILLQWY